MNNITLELFGSNLNKQDLKNIYALNQDNVPEVGSIENIEVFAELIRMSTFNLVAKYHDEIVGFIICFKESSEYQSLNYKFFKENVDTFLYIDRVAIKDGYRGKALGTQVYEKVIAEAAKLNVPVLCEVNTRPVNEPSLKFHEKMGFKECGTNDFSYNSVVYLRREIHGA
tara:strand:+ start:1129 stop:1638 length:510 start_codon:yes stop_codon:yes gene_type:complete